MNIKLQHILSLISFISHPIFLPIYLIKWLFRNPPSEGPGVYTFYISYDPVLRLLLLYILFTLVVPLFILVLLKIFGVIQSIYLSLMEDRERFFLIISIYYGLLVLIFDRIYSDGFFKITTLTVAEMFVLMFLCALITRNSFRVSIHTAGWGALTGFFVSCSLIFNAYYLSEIYLSVLIVGVVMWARMVEKAHSFTELLTGWALGIFTCVLVFLSMYQYL